AHRGGVGRPELVARTGELMPQTPASRRRAAAGRGGVALTLGLVPALFGAVLATQRPWTWTSGGWALTVFIVVSAVNLPLAVFVAAQAFTTRGDSRDPAGAGGATLLTILLLVTLATGTV